MTNIQFITKHLIKQANDYDVLGKYSVANQCERLASRTVEAQYGGGMAEYVEKLLELAKTHGIDYMQQRMKESRIVTLNDGTPIMKRNDPAPLINAVVGRAKALGFADTKNKTPHSPGKMDPKWKDETIQRGVEIVDGKSAWLNQAKPFSDAMADKKLNKYQWNPPAAKVQNTSVQGLSRPKKEPSKPTSLFTKPNLAPLDIQPGASAAVARMLNNTKPAVKPEEKPITKHRPIDNTNSNFSFFSGDPQSNTRIQR